MKEQQRLSSENADSVRDTVRKGYAGVVAANEGCCGAKSFSEHAETIGYDAQQYESVGAGANLGLGCGNPLSYANLSAGETVLDLGSGAGFDAFIAASEVGESGHVIGVDMTQAMLEKARDNAVKNGRANVEFRQGLIEALPVESDSVDVVTSNCVINLSPEKPKVFKEAFRVLKPGGRLVVSDIVLTAPLPAAVTENLGAYVACIAGASLRDDYVGAVREAGFTDVEIKAESPAAEALVGAGVEDPIVGAIAAQFSPEEIQRMAGSVVSLKLTARKPTA